MKIKHLEDNNLTYFQHLRRAWRCVFWLEIAAAAAFIHGIFPWWFETTATGIIRKLNDEK